MSLATASQVRLRIQDQPRLLNETRVGDGTATRHMLAQRNLTTASAFVPLNATSWTGTGATFNASGWVDFSGVISANSAWRFEAVTSVFSDDEIDHFIAVGSNVNGAALEAVRTLRFDGLRRARWSSPDGSSFDDTAALQALKDMEAALIEERSQDVFGGGSIESWSELQQDY